MSRPISRLGSLAALPLGVLLLSAPLARADVIVTGGNATDKFSAAALGETGTPYWNNTSSDGPKMNVGYFLTGTGGFTGNASSPKIALSNLHTSGRHQAAPPA
jgi:hypothetical protein